MAVRRYNYTQTALGDCGHIVTMWPLVASLGGHGKLEAICDVCTRQRYGISSDEELHVWVRVEDTEHEKEAKKVRKTAAARKPRTKTIRCSLCHQTGHDFMHCPLIASELSL